MASNLSSNAVNKSKSKVSGKGAVRAGKGFTLLISNEYMNDITKIIKSLEDSGVLINGVTETIFLRVLLAPLSTSLVQPVISSVVKGRRGWGVKTAGKK